MAVDQRKARLALCSRLFSPAQHYIVAAKMIKTIFVSASMNSSSGGVRRQYFPSPAPGANINARKDLLTTRFISLLLSYISHCANEAKIAK